MIVYGRRVIYELLRSPIKPKVIYLQKGAKFEDELLERIAGEKAVLVSQKEINKLTSTRDHQGIAADIGDFRTFDRKEIINGAIKKGKPVLVTDHIQDVRNLGSLIRSAEAFGFEGVVISSHRAAPITPAVVKSSAGAIFHIKIAIYNTQRFIGEFKRAGGWCVLLDMDGVDIRKAKKLKPFALVVGSEGEGVSKAIKDQADLVVKIPMFGKVESLNASVAGGIAMFYLSI
jgi:23S rRNA (guanosine2251-2'-O)-methyltransferase